MLKRHKAAKLSKATLSCVVVALALGCSWFRSTVNDTPSLRWWLFSNFGAQRVCPKVLASGIPLRTDPNGSVIGRFFPNDCQQRVDDAHQTMSLTFAGTGFAWTPIAGRIGFRAIASAEYRMDFRMESDALYVWGIPSGATTAAPQFQLGAVENPAVSWAAQGPVGYLASTFGSQIISSRIAEGFTAIRTDSGDEFALGHFVAPQRPPKPFALSGDDRMVLANETSEIRSGQIDLIGPLDVAKTDQALYLRVRVEGPQVEAFLYTKSVIDPWREALQTGASLAAPPAVPLASLVLSPGMETMQTLRVSAGSYIILVDHSSKIGRVNPPFSLLGLVGGGAAKLSYAIELGEAPH
jgi:hypothetical protein